MYTQQQIDMIFEILEDCKLVAYEKSGDRYSAVLCISPVCIDQIKMKLNMPVNEEI